MTQAATTNALAQKLSHGNLTTSGGLEKTVTGSGTNTAIDVKISDGGVTTAKLADNAVTTAKINDLNVTTGKLANGAVTGVENDATSIGTAKLALDTVGTPNLRDASVTSDKIDWTTLYFQTADLSPVSNATISAPWGERNVGAPASVPVEHGGRYLIIASNNYSTNKGTAPMSVGIRVSSGGNTNAVWQYVPPNSRIGQTWITNLVADGSSLTIQRAAYSSVTSTLDSGGTLVTIIRIG